LDGYGVEYVPGLCGILLLGVELMPYTVVWGLDVSVNMNECIYSKLMAALAMSKRILLVLSVAFHLPKSISLCQQ